MNQDTAQQRQQVSVQDEQDPKLTPHTLRLLRLITTSSSNESNIRESTGRAIYLLSKIASQSQPIILWDIIARLYSSLTSPDESDFVGGGVVRRNNVALALEHVARYIPIADQRSFLMGDFDKGNDNNSGLLVLKDDEKGRDGEGCWEQKELSRHWLCLKDFYINHDKEKNNKTTDEGGLIVSSLMDQILENGRLLLSCNETRYCKQDDVSDHDHETNMLAKLDAIATATANVAVSGNGAKRGNGLCMEDFTRERVNLQRNILARRLGLGGILSCPVVEQSVNHNIVGVVDEEDLLGTVPEKIRSSGGGISRLDDSIEKCNGMNARERNMVRLQQKRRRVESQKNDNGNLNNDDHDDDDNNHSSLRKLLLLSLKQNHRCDKQQQSSYSLTQLQSHKTPQILLTSDLVYHTFHPSWHIRHGALLGLKAILKSWKVTSFSSPLFSKWPEDITVRCLCVLGLDRFGDYSGPCLEVGSDENQNNISSHVAPVREVAAEIIALLLKMTSTIETRRYCLGLLKKMFLYKNHWEVRHGAMLAIQAIVNLNILSDDECGGYLYRESISMVIDGFSDDSDDIKSACAQAASYMLQSFDQYRKYNVPEHHFVTMCSGALWQALCKVDVTASCSHDLLKCMCDLIQHDCNHTLATIRHARESTIEELLIKICNFMDLPSDSIRFSCLKTLGLIVIPLSDMAMERVAKLECQKSTLENLFAILARIQRKLFDSLFNDAYDMEEKPSHAMHEMLVTERTKTWDSILNVLQRIMLMEGNLQSAVFRTIRETFFHLLRRYVGVEALEKHEWTYNISSKVHGQYFCQVAAAKAIISFYLGLLSEAEDIKRCIVIAILSLLDSPWVEHCELASILLASIPAEDNKQFSYIIDPSYIIEHCKNKLWWLLENNPICLLVSIIPNVESVRRDKVAKTLCDTLWVTSIQNSNIHDDSRVIKSVSEIKMGWCKIFKKYGIDYSTTGSCAALPSSISSVRLLSGLSAAVVALGCTGLPSKLTPVIRSLMTQLKNEDNNYRVTNAANVLSALINTLMISIEEKHRGSASKLISNICRMACVPNYVKVLPAGFTRRGCDGSKQVLRQIIKCMTTSQNIQHIEAIWSRLEPLTTSDPAKCDFSRLSEALSLLSCVSSAMIKQSSSVTYIVTMLLPTTLLLACTSPCIGMRQDATDSVRNLCEIDVDLTMPFVIPHLQGYATDVEDDPKRLGAAVLLNSVVRNGGVTLCPYVRYLLPIAMPAMTDPLKDCAELSASTFSHLVRLAPLVDTDTITIELSSEFHVDKNIQDSVQSVMDHLIIGKPLPPHHLPSSISTALQSSLIHLRKYQMEGISWMQFLKNVRLNGALCDDMGLGKTMQALIGLAITHLELKSRGMGVDHKSLVVCPSSVSGQWVNEITKLGFSDSIMNVLHYTGSKRKLQWDKNFCKSDIIITSYNVLRSDIDRLRQYAWTYCILDEGHLLKNPRTLTAKAARQLRCSHKLILSGTPVQNNVNELWSIFDWLMPNYLGSNVEFSQNYARIITKGNLPTASSVEIRQGMEKLKQLHQQVLPFILRREKGDVAKELPQKIITDIPCAMTEFQRRLYAEHSNRKETKRALDLLEEMVARKDNCQNDETANNKLNQNLLQTLLSLRFICTHPILLSRSKNVKPSCSIPSRFDSSGKLLALNDLLRRARIVQDEDAAADNDRSLLYIEDENFETNSADAFLKEIGSDSDILEDGFTDIDDIETNNNSKCLIFAQFSQSLDIVEELLFKRVMPSLRYVRLDGKTPPSDRSEIIEAFQMDDTIRCMLLTSKVGSLGLNLQAADTVIFLESDWNPFVDLQAMDRSHRIGQKNMVKVYRLITEDSIEEKIMAIQKAKIAMSEAIVNTENSTLYSMGTDRLLDLFSTSH